MGCPKFCGFPGQDPGWSTSGLWFVIRIPVKLGYLKFCGLAVKIPGWDTSKMWLRGQDRYLKFVASWSASRLGYLKFCGFAVKILVGIPQQVCGFAVRIPVGIPQVLWLRGQYPDWDTSSFAELLWLRGQDLGLWLRGADPGWDTSSFVVSRARSRLGYLEFVASQSRSRLGHLKFVASWSIFRLGYTSSFVASLPQVSGVGIPQTLWLRPGWDTSSLWFRGQDPGRDTSSLVASWSRRDTSASRSRSRSGYLKFCDPV